LVSDRGFGSVYAFRTAPAAVLGPATYSELVRILDRLLRRDSRLAKRIAAGIELNRVAPARDVNGWDEIAAYARENDQVLLDGANWIFVGPDGVSRIMCPGCWNGGGGTLAQIRMKGSPEIFYWCDECDSLWPVEQFDWKNAEAEASNRSVALRERGLNENDWEAA
jgi:hypothetical protein